MVDAASSVLLQHVQPMHLLDHLEELRKRIIFAVVAVFVGFLLCWSCADRIFPELSL
jgi:Sec-independent protein secretion pathway component TatC